MTVLLFLFGVFLAMGLFFLASSFLRLPTLRTARAMLGTVRQEKKTVKTIEACLMSAAVYLSKYIHMEAYRRGRLDRILKAGGMNLSPEVYQAYALVKTGAVLLGTIPCVLFVPLLTPVIVILAVLLYFQEMQKADERLKAKRDEIEAQLPRLVATIEQELKSGRNVVGMLERFRMNAGESLSGELDILIADMRSSNYEAALTRFESRINSPMLSDVVRGLIGVLRGDDSAVYFQMLSHDFKQIELQRLKAEAQKIPPKIRVFSFVMLMCFLLTYLTIICYVAIENLGGMLVLALCVQVLPVFVKKQQLDVFATELVREAEISGRVGAETDRREESLIEKTGLEPDISWSQEGRIQLNKDVSVTLTYETNIGLFGKFGSFPVTLRAEASGKSEVYWK